MKISNEFKVGILAVASILLFIFGYNYLKGNNLLQSSRTFYAVYDNVEGLSKSSPVTINGLQVGSVTDITFLNQTGELLVTMNINNDFQFSNKSKAKIYGGNLIGSKSMAIEPVYKSQVQAKTGDTLPGIIDPGLLELVNNQLTPLQTRIEKVVTDVDTVVSSVNNILNLETQENLRASILEVKKSLTSINKVSEKANDFLDNNKKNINESFANINKASKSFSDLSDSIAQIEINKITKDLETSIANIKGITQKIDNGQGSLGKLINDDQVYQNLEASTQELEKLLNDFKNNPKRYVHFSIFGKKNRPYKENDK